SRGAADALLPAPVAEPQTPPFPERAFLVRRNAARGRSTVRHRAGSRQRGRFADRADASAGLGEGLAQLEPPYTQHEECGPKTHPGDKSQPDHGDIVRVQWQ